MDGGQPPVGPDLLRFQPYLRILVRSHFDPRLQAKLDPSDVVQDVLVQAVRAFAQYRGRTDAELAGWLRQVLIRTLANTARDFARDKRDAGRERAVASAVEETSVRLEALLAADASSPSQRAARNEEMVRLAAAVERLPDAQREALTLHHLHGWKLDEVAGHMNRTPVAVAGLIKRAVRQLRQELAPDGPTG
jgi:RNA polymerase sigma-70 factor, ECF subfamily